MLTLHGFLKLLAHVFPGLSSFVQILNQLFSDVNIERSVDGELHMLFFLVGLLRHGKLDSKLFDEWLPDANGYVEEVDAAGEVSPETRLLRVDIFLDFEVRKVSA